MLRQAFRGSVRLAAAVRTGDHTISHSATICRASTIVSAKSNVSPINQQRFYSAKVSLLIYYITL